jgi:prepilin-type N-terminal cleavage/methylation domain-containing protein
MKGAQGFTLVETLISILIILVLLGATVSSLNDAFSVNKKTTLIADLEQNLRAGMNFVVRDFINAGWGIPTGGLPIPSGAGVTPVTRPGPPGTNYTFSPALNIAAVNPGANMGLPGNNGATDIVNLLCADNVLPLNQTPLVSIAANGSSMTVNPGTPITGVPNAIRPGDLIAFSNALGNTLQYATRVAGQTVFFDPGDPMNLNQPTAPQGSIMQIQSGGIFPPTTATRVWLITYFLDTTTDPVMPRLIRRINDRPGETVALVLEDLQLSYDLVDGVTNPTNVETPIAPNSPNQIRKVNVLLSGRSSEVIQNTNQFLRRNLATQVSLRSLSFIDRYI